MCGPRACGGVPIPRAIREEHNAWSPRLRGCSRPTVNPSPQLRVVPAPAGVFPWSRQLRRWPGGGPRVCGGVPARQVLLCGCELWSPCLRGCSRHEPERPRRHDVVPAPAGVFPSRLSSRARQPCGPRACGVFPDRSCSTSCRPCGPRACGGVPRAASSPCWTGVAPAPAGVFPAPPRPAGRATGGFRERRVFPVRGRWQCAWPCGPRACRAHPEQSRVHEPRVVPRLRGHFRREAAGDRGDGRGKWRGITTVNCWSRWQCAGAGCGMPCCSVRSGGGVRLTSGLGRCSRASRSRLFCVRGAWGGRSFSTRWRRRRLSRRSSNGRCSSTSNRRGRQTPRSPQTSFGQALQHSRDMPEAP